MNEWDAGAVLTIDMAQTIGYMQIVPTNNTQFSKVLLKVPTREVVGVLGNGGNMKRKMLYIAPVIAALVFGMGGSSQAQTTGSSGTSSTTLPTNSFLPAGQQPNASPESGTLCLYNAPSPEKLESGAGDGYEVDGTVEFSCMGGSVYDVRFYGCIQHSKDGSTDWANDDDSCEPAGGYLYENGDAVTEADTGYVHVCISNTNPWYYRTHFEITGYYTDDSEPFNTGYQVSEGNLHTDC